MDSIEIIEALETGSGRLALAGYDDNASLLVLYTGIERRLSSLPDMAGMILALSVGCTTGWLGRSRHPQRDLDGHLDDPAGCRVIGRWFSGSGLDLTDRAQARHAGIAWATPATPARRAA